MNKIVILLLSLLIFYTTLLSAQLNGKIKLYFTNPINTGVSSGVNAVYLNNSMDDTLVAYINRAKYSLDIAVYNYQQSTGMANIATAINNAAANGVIVRWIYDSNQSNSGMSALNANMHTLGSPASNSTYGIMHNKFMLVDANSSNINDPLVWTGSTNWTKTHFNSNVNNTLIIQDKNLVQAFLTEFNEMWGSTGVTPNTTNSKFGPNKTDNTPHLFSIGGNLVELYFSPSDQTNTHVLDVINSASTDLYFGMLSFSLSNNADSIINKKNNGIYVAGIIDQTSQIYFPYSSLNTSLGANFKVYSQFTSVYHNKILIVDPCNSSDPSVVTGSYNWTSPASTQNDENALIIHDDTVANIFYQSFYQNFTDLGGTLLPCITTGLNENSKMTSNESFIIYPNPFSTQTIFQTNSLLTNATLSIYNCFGQMVKERTHISGQTIVISRDNLASGLYFVQLKQDNKEILTKKIIIVD